MTSMQTTSTSGPAPIGGLIKEWRARRRLSQLDLALEAGVSQRHLSFVESGRSQPSRDMVETLAETMELPLRERNVLLLSAGFAPAYAERNLDDPSMTAARSAVELVLKAHAPNPAFAVDRLWRAVMANDAAGLLMGLVEDKSLVAGQFNVLRAAMHPKGLAAHIVNLAEWRGHIFHRLRRQIETTADAELAALEKELAAMPAPPGVPRVEPRDMIALPLVLKVGDMRLSFISTITIFGTPVDVTLSELAIEAFFPADEATAGALRAMTGG